MRVIDTVPLRVYSGVGAAVLATRGEVESFFRAEYHQLVRVARLIVDDHSQAEEIVQDAFVQLVLRWDSIERPAAFLRTAVVNGGRGNLRRRVIARRHLRTSDDVGATGPEDLAVLSHEHQRAATALRGLSRRQRACVALRFYDDRTEAEIAEILGISVGSVKTYTRRGMAALLTALEDLR